MRLVLDASVAVHLLVPGPLQVPSRRGVLGAELVSPSLVDTEVVSALARLERSGAISTGEADGAVDAWLDLPCERIPTTSLLRHIWHLRGRLRTADAHYLALAVALSAPLLTADRRLASAVPAGTTVHLIG